MLFLLNPIVDIFQEPSSIYHIERIFALDCYLRQKFVCLFKFLFDHDDIISIIDLFIALFSEDGPLNKSGVIMSPCATALGKVP